MAKKTHPNPQAARDAILDAAEQLVLDSGPAGLRISAVAQLAGMAHPNIIYHFGTREGLLDALAERVGARATDRITKAINAALLAAPEDCVAAMTHVLDCAYQGDQGKVAVWMHLSGHKSSLKANMQRIVKASHQLRKAMNGEAELADTNRLVLLVTLALIGEVVSGAGVKQALGFDSTANNRANFRQWLAELLLNLSAADLLSNLGTGLLEHCSNKTL